MEIEEIFQDKSIKLKGKVAILGARLLNGDLSLQLLLEYADQQKAIDKATCLEAIEYATKKNSTIANSNLLDYVTHALKDNEPRVKWESAKIVGNITKLFPDQLDKTVANLLKNTRNSGTVVRWATAYALAEIIKLKTVQNDFLIPEVELLCELEEDNGVKKKYLDVLKKIKK
ncbi:hypothetical protein [Sphingobacterium sp. BIGb0165]|uniref:hypothetical protein n=1 Tax=Sphingobacterium sp. BIGb0165 TaxID=2940615 RepID=UPI002169B1CD|nr:hypothetical protein [Sphingobacterium sp. BIGb0165]MCS4229142.1 hypothetical protein [Sphingobacterium sp. BIGb0165]